MPRDKLDYLGIKALAEKLGRPVSTLYALSAVNDPFFIAPYRAKLAEWFAAEWRRLKIPAAWHYRRIHYVFVSQDGRTAVVMLSGEPYHNSGECWDTLCQAARDAIALELVPTDAFVDHRNAVPIEYLVKEEPGSTSLIDDEPDCFIPRFPDLPSVEFKRPTVPQRYHIELWVEKTTVNDVLEPLAREYKLNLVTGIGELSATRCREFVDRAQRSRRPVRVFYISDFDPAGSSMPVAVARKIEFEIRGRGLGLDVQLRPIALTHEQCVANKLPRTPLKETERRAQRFEERFGAGGTELDALEALHPGMLREIVLSEVRRYWNRDHDQVIEKKCEEIEEECAGLTAAAHATFREEIAALQADWQKIVSHVRAWEERAKPTWFAITENLVYQRLYFGDVDFAPAFAADEDPDPLYDSTRSYLEQIDRYKRHQGKPTSRKVRQVSSPRSRLETSR